MSRLIDADAFSAVMKQRQDTVKEWMCKGKDKETCARAGSSYVMLCEVKLTLDQMPTIDAVEVVHCRECKWLHIVNDNILYGFCTKGHAMFYPFQLDTRDFFCADGERRDNE